MYLREYYTLAPTLHLLGVYISCACSVIRIIFLLGCFGRVGRYIISCQYSRIRPRSSEEKNTVHSGIMCGTVYICTCHPFQGKGGWEPITGQYSTGMGVWNMQRGRRG